jgi:hypothetical protein
MAKKNLLRQGVENFTAQLEVREQV